MNGVELGLEIAFYLYPCSLFASLALAQLVRYRHRNDRVSAVVDEKRAEKVNRLHNRLIRIVQSLLPPLLVSTRCPYGSALYRGADVCHSAGQCGPRYA